MTIESYRLKSFIDNDLKVFSNLDNVRSIPSIVDGLKDSQRKAVFSMLKQNSNEEIKVAQLGNYASKETHYKHGEVSMCDTIVGLAQDFPGSNNINLFEPIGQFGSILSSESSEHRYIYTKPSKYLKTIIRPSDNLILKYKYVEGHKVEPETYYPLLPLWLVNGCEGIGTGHSTKILSRNPKDVASVINKIINGVTPQQKTIDSAMTPWFKGWTGEVKSTGVDNQWELHGRIETINNTTLRVTELPVMYSIDKFKEILIKLMDEGKVRDYENNSTDEGFDITITVPREIGRKDNAELMQIFKLVKTITENVTLWDLTGSLKRYSNVYEALLEWVTYRTDVYESRRISQIESLTNEISFIKNKILFIEYWNTKMKDANKKSRSDIENEISSVVDSRYFDQLFSMQISSLTMERVESLKRDLDNVQSERSSLQNTNAANLFSSELSDF